MRQNFLSSDTICFQAFSNHLGRPGRVSKRLALLCLVAALIPFSGCADSSTVDLDGENSQSTLPVPVAAFSESSTSAQNEVSTTKTIAVPANGPVQQAVAIEVQEKGSAAPAPEPDSEGVFKKAGDLFDKAKSTTGSTAKGAKDWVQDKIGGAADASSAATEDTIKWATDTFESLKAKGLTTASDTSEWLSQDWKNMESWEYRIERMSKADGEIVNALNELGKNGWECYHVSEKDDGNTQRFYLKKRKDSYLRHLPFNDFIKLVPLLQQADN